MPPFYLKTLCLLMVAELLLLCGLPAIQNNKYVVRNLLNDSNDILILPFPVLFYFYPGIHCFPYSQKLLLKTPPVSSGGSFFDSYLMSGVSIDRINTKSMRSNHVGYNLLLSEFCDSLQSLIVRNQVSFIRVFPDPVFYLKLSGCNNIRRKIQVI